MSDTSRHVGRATWRTPEVTLQQLLHAGEQAGNEEHFEGLEQDDVDENGRDCGHRPEVTAVRAQSAADHHAPDLATYHQMEFTVLQVYRHSAGISHFYR